MGKGANLSLCTARERYLGWGRSISAWEGHAFAARVGFPILGTAVVPVLAVRAFLQAAASASFVSR